MKTLTTLILLLFCSITFAQTSLEFEGGYFSRHNTITDTKQWLVKSNTWRYPIYTQITLSQKIKSFTVYTKILNSFACKGITTFRTGQAEYIVGVKYSINRYTIGYEHMCSHPVITNTQIFEEMFRDSYDKIYLKIKLL